VNGAHAYARAGTLAVRVTIHHNLGNTTEATTDSTATVRRKLPPRQSPGLHDPRQPYVLSLRSFRAGTDPIRSWIINWGDGTVQRVVGNPRRLSHPYELRTQSYTITARVTYQDGTWTSHRMLVTMSLPDLPARDLGDSVDSLPGVGIASGVSR
jgi:hypothetical protein